MRTHRKTPRRVSTPPTLSLGVVFFGVAAVLAAAGALVRYYARSHGAARASDDAAVEIPAPDLEPLPAPPPGATTP